MAAASPVVDRDGQPLSVGDVVQVLLLADPEKPVTAATGKVASLNADGKDKFGTHKVHFQGSKD
jgi:hypothetical protein